MKLLLGTITSALCLCQCTTFQPGRADGIDPNPFNLMEQQATAANHDASRISVPVLRSPTLEKRWGRPRLLVGAKGGYALRYEDPANHHRQLTIFGSPQRFKTAGPIPPPYTDLGHDEKRHTFTPVEVSQKWQSATIAGRSVRFCIAQGESGEEPLQYSTETFLLTAPDGRTASYRVRTAAQGGKPADAAKNLLRTASF